MIKITKQQYGKMQNGGELEHQEISKELIPSIMKIIGDPDKNTWTHASWYQKFMNIPIQFSRNSSSGNVVISFPKENKKEITKWFIQLRKTIDAPAEESHHKTKSGKAFKKFSNEYASNFNLKPSDMQEVLIPSLQKHAGSKNGIYHYQNDKGEIEKGISVLIKSGKAYVNKKDVQHVRHLDAEGYHIQKEENIKESIVKIAQHALFD